ncbi:phage tail tube protein [Limimaricola variabilis]|uniref:phage tail tube protein n=1 Tax=Limimaricola variabilis TaxID=1492771 RepID=UPI002AC8FD1F|nr:phage tail tube protein [Limimaricola variabilis]WPY93157.1 phage tail tube protein [Limimaricola variabilis]
MPETKADIGFGAVFGIEGATPGTYAPAAEVIAITPPSRSREAIDATHLNSPDAYREFIAGIMEGGEASLTLNFEPSETDTLVDAFEAGKGKYEIIFPNGVKMQFSGIFTSYELGELVDNDKMTATCTIKQSGKATLVAA